MSSRTGTIRKFKTPELCQTEINEVIKNNTDIVPSVFARVIGMKLRKIREAEIGEKFTLTIISYRKKLLDYDNLIGGCKQLLDACSDEKLIWDDAPKYLDLKVEQHIGKKYETIIIREKV